MWVMWDLFLDFYMGYYVINMHNTVIGRLSLWYGSKDGYATSVQTGTTVK